MMRRLCMPLLLLLLITTAKTTVADLNATELDCAMRRFAVQYARRIQPWRDRDDMVLRQVHDALQLEELCHEPFSPPALVGPLQEQQVTMTKQRQRRNTEEEEMSFHNDECPTRHCLWVVPTRSHSQTDNRDFPKNPTNSSSSSSSNDALTFSSLHHALAYSRHPLGQPHATTIMLQPGMHHLHKPVILKRQDAGLQLRGVAGTTWITGSIPIPPDNDTIWDYDCSVNLNVRVANLTRLLQGRTLPRLPSLFGHYKRWNRARYPNGDFETVQWGYASPGRRDHAINANTIHHWHKPAKGQPPKFTYIDLRPLGKNDSTMELYNVYASGQGGVCDVLWGPEPSYWCSNASAGGWASVDRACATQGQLQIPVGLTLSDTALQRRFGNWRHGASGGIIHAWHSQSWAMHMFGIAAQPNATTLCFAPGGGQQGGRNWCQCNQCPYAGGWCGQHETPPRKDDDRLISGSWLVENVLDELDEPGEYYFNTTSKLLYIYPNKTADDPTGRANLHLAVLEDLFVVQNVANITFTGIGFRETASTYMNNDWGVPSGGDWALRRGGALFFENVSNVLIENCIFHRLDGNAVFLSRRTRNVAIRKSVFEWIGENAIATWGQTTDYDGLAREFPIGTLVEGNVMRELGIYQKQSSAFANNKAAISIIRNNIMFNTPRAAVNFNDMLGGGDVVYRNLMFNTCRESGDHGAINSWDRQPFLSDLRDGTPSFVPKPRKISYNFIISNYGSGSGLDNDDGSSWYNVHRNVLYNSEGFKMDYGGHDSIYTENVVITFPPKWGQMCIGFGEFFPLHGHQVINNTCIVSSKDKPMMYLGHCKTNPILMVKNQYYTPDGEATVECAEDPDPISFQELQKKYGLEIGSQLHHNPNKTHDVLDLVKRYLFS